MSNLNDSCKEFSEKVCDNRRDFLVKASVTAGGLLLSLSGASLAKAETTDTTPEEVVVKLDDKSPLNKVGGNTMIDTKNGKVIVIRTSETTFSAYSAVCTHKGAMLGYNAESKLLVCPSHGSKFDSTGKPVGGPAKTQLPVYGAQESVVVTLS
jgi:cytochrome b6-f complex iron-sulfur subunit